MPSVCIFEIHGYATKLSAASSKPIPCSYATATCFLRRAPSFQQRVQQMEQFDRSDLCKLTYILIYSL